MKKLKKIMLVDDDDTTNFYNQFLINKMGAADEVLVALNGQEALDILTTKDSQGNYPVPELILLDINMPIMNGFEFLEAYENINEAQKANVVICMLTTSLHDKDLNKSKEFLDIGDYTNKPLSEEKLTETIEKHFK